MRNDLSIIGRLVISGGSLLPHPGRPLGVGRARLLQHGLLSVSRHERLRPLPDCLHRGALHRHLPPNEGTGDLSQRFTIFKDCNLGQGH